MKCEKKQYAMSSSSNHPQQTLTTTSGGKLGIYFTEVTGLFMYSTSEWGKKSLGKNKKESFLSHICFYPFKGSFVWLVQQHIAFPFSYMVLFT